MSSPEAQAAHQRVHDHLLQRLATEKDMTRDLERKIASLRKSSATLRVDIADFERRYPETRERCPGCGEPYVRTEDGHGYESGCFPGITKPWCQTAKHYLDKP